MNTALNDPNNKDHDLITIIFKNMDHLLNMCKDMTVDKVLNILKDVLQTLSFMGFERIGNRQAISNLTNEIKKLRDVVGLQRSEINDLYKMINSTTEENKQKARRLKEKNIRAQEIINNKYKDNKYDDNEVDDMLIEFWIQK
ncbi:hypothetical protein CBEVV_012 [Choristoneura biennis entomopoxvirus 'L' virophage]|nr:hypothetical protein CBEVV_012 [Choristoneura biennis entomopoxvirus 'L' virophage]